MNQQIKRNGQNAFLIGLLVLVLIPIITYGLSVFPLLPSGNNDWSGFWGSYFGAIIGGFITWYVMNITLENENKTKAREEKITFFNDIVKLSVKMFSEIGNLGITTSRDMLENTEELHQRSLCLNNTVVQLNTEIEILLETRKDVYDVEELCQKIKALGNSLDSMMDSYEEAVKSKFRKGVSEYNNKKEFAEKCVEECQKCLKETVKNNLE